MVSEASKQLRKVPGLAREKNPPFSEEKKTRVRDFFKSDETDEECFAVALFTSTVGFSQLDTPEWRRFFKRLGFELPNVLPGMKWGAYH
ncbi:hypothetical protein K3495_g13021 [Podosphaera aphanis]|nr:hypothetical protein K3495_g13021 [Podosphaera aphanis]